MLADSDRLHAGEASVAPHLQNLPNDTLSVIMVHAGAPALLTLSETSRSFRAIAQAESTWQDCYLRRFGPVMAALYPGEPLGLVPGGGTTWQHHYIETDLTWLNVAFERTGRILIRLNGRLYDCTDFLPDHPGDPQLILASAGMDATEAFEYVGHSANATRLLLGMEVPHLNVPQQFRRTDATRHGAGTAGPADDGANIHVGWLRWAASAVRDGLDALRWVGRQSLQATAGSGGWRQAHVLQLLRVIIDDDHDDVGCERCEKAKIEP